MKVFVDYKFQRSKKERSDEEGKQDGEKRKRRRNEGYRCSRGPPSERCKAYQTLNLQIINLLFSVKVQVDEKLFNIRRDVTKGTK